MRDLSAEFTFAYCPTEYSVNNVYSYDYAAVLNGEELDFYHSRFNLLYHFDEVSDRFVPFLNVGSGLVLLNGYQINNELSTEVTCGIGMKIFLTDDLIFRMDTNYVLLMDKWIKRTFNPATGNLDFRGTGHFNNLEAVFSLAYLFGGKDKDSDGDGVANDIDACPDTPKGVEVDGKGCPMDSDNDGVFDGIDKCPGTPAGAWVDSKGCPKDSDGDGVLDGLDQCPDTPLGTVVNEDGCPLDSDGDGVFDGVDQCPNTPMGAMVDDQGCPIDSDGDGVPDGLDKCPGTPPGSTVNADGCPAVGADLLEKGLATLGINFATNSASISPSSHAAMDEVAAILQANPTIKVEVGGHSDSTGAAAYNQKLSLRRADSVKNYLVAKGVSADQLVAKGYGESQPVASNLTVEGRKENRRIEFKVISRKGMVIGGINFKSGSATLDPASYGVLDGIVKIVMETAPNVVVEIGGHTDSSGDAAKNMELSLKRAQSVKKYLVDKGVPDSRLICKGYGESRPLTSNKTPEGRAQNRRIEFKNLAVK
jgi:OOP family OmpA-OmpF porin